MLKVIEGRGWLGRGRDGDLVGANQRAAHAMVEVEVELGVTLRSGLWPSAAGSAVRPRLWEALPAHRNQSLEQDLKNRPTNRGQRENSSSGHS
jgi:hypothetical protein